MDEIYVVHVTRGCNADCKYCYEADSDRSIRYSEEEVVSYCKSIISNRRTADRFNIEFIGGEPTLAVNNIIAAYNIFERLAPKIVQKYIITTNGILTPDPIIDLLKKDSRFKWSVSIDGGHFANSLRVDKLGYGLLERSLRSFDKIKEAGIPDEQISVHLVSHPYNIYLLENSIEFLYNKGFRNIGVGIIEKSMSIGKEFCDRYLEEFAKVSKRIHAGEFKDINIDVFSHIKPRDDRRFYIKDKDGKLLGESYGRSGDDITASKEYDPVQGTSKVTDLITIIKEVAYYKHLEGIYE